MKRYLGKKFVTLLLSQLFIFSTLCTPALAVNVPVEKLSIYEILFRLEAEGIIKSSLLTTLPLNKQEIKRLIKEARDNSEEASAFTKSLVDTLEQEFRDDKSNIKYIKPISRPYIKYVYSDTELQTLNYNNNGDRFEKDSNFRLGFSSVAEFGKLSLLIAPELRLSNDDTDLVLKKGYGIFHLLGLDLELGKDSQWWGPGYHGSLLLSNNAEPFTMIKVTNPRPVLLPWVFRYLGPFRFAFFVTKLESDRTVPKPYLWGLRFNFKPIPYLEIGLQRTALLGGKGRSEDLATWLRSFTGRGENETGIEAGDQRAGIDIKITVPNKIQPIQFYLEAAGEDEAGGLPSRWAFVGGIYIPRILTLENISLRIEYADTTAKAFNSSESAWYKHHIYRSGYTYKGRVIGHHMGTDSRDLFIQIKYYLPEMKGAIYVSFDKEKHDYSKEKKSVSTELSSGLEYKLRSNLKIVAEIKTAKLENFTNNDDNRVNLVALNLTYIF